VSENAFQLPDDITYEMIEESLREREQWRKQIESYLWKKGYTGYHIISYGGLIFIFNKTKTRQEQFKWLKKYSEVLRAYGIEAKVYNDRPKPYICF
jgi:hypothetical protein